VESTGRNNSCMIAGKFVRALDGAVEAVAGVA